MTKENSNRRGSALLIVLGMLSFMIVSAVAFSVYMRTSRAPSSYLRRSVSTQHLVKAALARAIEDIDDHIGNDPYPGVGPMSILEIPRNWVDPVDRREYRGRLDSWKHRVFCPYADAAGDTTFKTSNGTNGSGELDTDGADNCVEFGNTISVLTLEGLGYIPAPYVNQVRYWSRRSQTANTKDFNYDLGRWAYNAINVSDLLDVNSIRAYTNRNSGAYGRLSLSSTVKAAGIDPKAFDDFVKNRGGTESQMPFVSIMDFNLAAGKSGTVKSPFYNWITQGGNNGFYGNSPSNEVAPLVFITDSWYPPTNQFSGASSANNAYYLSRADHQPFMKAAFDSQYKDGLMDVIREGNVNREPFDNIFSKYLRAVGCACLYDYLDKDSVPLSLATPSTEAVPMVTGISFPDPNMKLTISMNPPSPPPSPSSGGTSAPVTQLYEYKVKFDDFMINMNATLLYPFKRIEKERLGNFRVQAMVRMCLAPENMPMRVGVKSPLHPTRADWEQMGATPPANGIYTFVSSMQSIKLPDAANFDKGEDEEAIIDVQLSFTGKYAGNSDGEPLLTYSEDVTPGSSSTPANKKIDFLWLPYDSAGNIAKWSGTGFSSSFANNRVRPTFFVWFRVVDSEGKTVDLAPAMLQDDQLNEVSNWGDDFYTELDTICGRGVPLFNFPTKDFEIPTVQADILSDVTHVFGGGIPNSGNVQLSKSVPFSGDYTSIYCYDPRYNFAPEDWYAVVGAYDANKWIDDVGEKLLGKDGRDSDVFMFVSNQEYLQSIGELAFLPRLQDFERSGDDPLTGDFFDRGRYNGANLTFAKDSGGNDRRGFDNGLAAAANRAFFWRTYRCYEQGGLTPDRIYNLVGDNGKRMFDDDGRGPRVNPYTEDLSIFMVAIGDTPYDYWAASTNISLGTKYANNFASNPSEALKHCFNEDSPLAKTTENEMRGIARVMSMAMRAMVDGNWLVGFNALDWYGNGDPQCFLNAVDDTKSEQNLKSTAFNEVDRKFLYSFWRNCFGNRQQLFIVFVRAEPVALGGAQQGGRAVALVWRDPAPPIGYADRTCRKLETINGTEDNILPPHRTRVLFYHQFD